MKAVLTGFSALLVLAVMLATNGLCLAAQRMS